MHILIETRSFERFTDDELYAFCMANKGLRIERNKKGQLEIMPPTGLETSFRNTELNTELNIWNRKNRLGLVSESNGGYTLPNGAMRTPDVAWISTERWANVPPAERKKFAHVCPDFVIELLSESDSLSEGKAKMEEWRENGCRLGWLINPKDKNVFIYRENGEIIIQSFEQKLSGENVLLGFEMDLKEIFAE
ncbi:MAG: Uma2 family endonuclease [Thermoflexibacter sp.]|jgi:Uma2 family endonuclease|nr:Uma2 family endonuclease [Thermoflexibacter sp.]